MGYARTEFYSCDSCSTETEQHTKGGRFGWVLEKSDAPHPLDGWFDIDITEHGDGESKDKTITLCPPCAMKALDLLDSI